MKRTAKLNKKLEVVRTIIRPLTADQLSKVVGGYAYAYAYALPRTFNTCLNCCNNEYTNK
jgi:hypothetical protein